MTTTPVRVRFAPSPTGKLHVGGARTAIYNWAFARHTGGTFVLRIEDTDPTRSTEENTQVILRAMRWLGIDWDEGPEAGGDFGPYRQTERLDTYVAALEQLKAAGKVYPCFCTKEKLDAKRAAAHEAGKAYEGYDRTCRDIDPDEAARRIEAGEPHVWRLKVPLDHGPIEFDDAVLGHMSFPIDVMDDMVLVRSDGSPMYNFAVVCDDTNMRITHVIRGGDHVSNTPRQILIYEALGYPVPQFAHLSMINGPDGKKLSKRHGATSVEQYRDEGYLPEALVNYLALLGWAPDGETTIFSEQEMCERFELSHISKNPAVFDVEKLDWMNLQYLMALSPAGYVDAAAPFLEAAGLATPEDIAAHRDWYEAIVPLINERCHKLSEVPAKVAFLFGDGVELEERSVSKVLAKDGAADALHAARETLTDIAEEDWDESTLEQALRGLSERTGLKPKKLFQPVRVATTGSMVSPPLFGSLALLGRTRTLARIDAALPSCK